MALTPKENLEIALRHEEPEWVPRYDEGVFVHVGVEAWRHGGMREEGAEWRDAWGVLWRQGDPRVDAYVAESPLRTIDGMRRYEMPDPARDELLDQAKATLAGVNRDEHLIVGAVPCGAFERAWTLLGMENFLMLMLTDPDEVSAFIGRIMDNHIVLAGRLIELGIDIGGVVDDYGTTQALMVRPEVWRAVIKPHLARYYAVHKAAGCLVNQHSCGAVTAIMPDLIEIGLDMLNPLQASAMDHAEVKARFGRDLVLWGGVSADVLTRGTRDQIIEEVKTRLRILAPGGGYLAGPDQGLPWPEANYATYLEAVQQYGRYPITIPI